MLKEGIIFEPSAPYFQKQNIVSKKVGQTIMDMVCTTILYVNIDDDLWPKIILAIIYIKNIKLISLLKDRNLYNIYFNKVPTLSYLQVLGFIVYVFIYKEKQNLKSEKFEVWALKKRLLDTTDI